MHIAILTFDGFNELDSLIAYGMLSRISLLGDANWKVSIASPTVRVTSMNGLTIDAHIDLNEANSADAVLIGSGMKTREVAGDNSILSQIQLDPERQLIAAQCSGTFLLAKLGLLGKTPACTDTTSKPWVQAAGINILNQAFFAQGNVATAGGCLSAQYISAWMIARLKGMAEAKEVLHYFAPVGEKEEYVTRARSHIEEDFQEHSSTLKTLNAS
ncbi:DJ-1/PfpI family protein [Glaciimonas sp. Gout2]|uniref:DJ-1/PfpI family protein n=1 Tax=unclassified Glaciimonas TaxID=2644401 RepID=UPI002B228A48|nr:MULTISPECIES: DJ-1/PfpI family protein [unclassified Glaciimonas]MEB0012281.1 DJ-1/PfpI family protein [Glaciimonas sp. Cout2]MEB0080531.1 DJ-1/PfpI family protein [Glaciimonas sp. Gout2]